MAFKVVPWSESLDLSSFYEEADRKGFKNNNSQKSLVDCFKNEREKQVWILYYNDEPIGSVASHSFDDVMGPNTYRIAARACVFSDKIPKWNTGLKTKTGIVTMQNPVAQFLIPTCIEWAPKDSRLFITSNESSVGTQRRVHNIFGPVMEQHGIMARIKDVEYRGHVQTVWELYPDRFLKQLNSNVRWLEQ